MEIKNPVKKTSTITTADLAEEFAVEEMSTAQTTPPKLMPGFKFTGLIQSTPEMLESLRNSVEFIVDQRLEQTMRLMEERLISILENKLENINTIPNEGTPAGMTNLQIMNKILERDHDYLVQNYKGKFVGLNFEGTIVASSSSELDLLNKIEELSIPKNQIFVYSVPLV